MSKFRGLREYSALFLLALIWAAELWFVQAATTEPTLWHDSVAVFKDQLYRGILDLGIVLTVLLIAPWWAIIPIFIVNFVFSGVVLSYFETYDRAMSVFVVIEQWREGLEVAGGGAQLVAGSLLVLAVVGVVKLGMLVWQRKRVGSARRPGLALAAAWLVFVGILHLDHKDMARLATFEQVGGIAHVYGYLPTWAAELHWVEQDQVVDEAFARLQIRSNNLAAAEPPIAAERHVVVVQVESLDAAVVGFEIDGRPVTPRLNELRENSYFFQSQARKLTGSCDADFVALMGRLASPRMVGWRIEELPFETAVVDAFRDAGYRTGFWHGVSGNFFYRRDAFARMGWDSLKFREEFVADRGADPELWAVDDGTVFDWASTWPRSAPKTFTMVITATSHLPFNFPTPGMEPEFFGGSSLPNRAYFDSIHYVDAQIGRFIDGLPDDTLVIVYGDHWSKMRDEELGYDHTVIDGFGLVPVFVHVTGHNIASQQHTRGTELALAGQITLLDVFSWMWGSFEPTIAWSPDGRTRSTQSASMLAVTSVGPRLRAAARIATNPFDNLFTLSSL